MKKGLLFVITISIMFLTNAQNVVIEVKKTATPIVIDGETDAAWAAAEPILINQWGVDKTPPQSFDFEASFKLLWDDDYLYFLGTINDNILLSQEKAADLNVVDWEVDNWELYWSPGNSYLDNASEMIQVRLAYAYANNADPCASTKNGWSPGNFQIDDFVNAAMIDLGDSYIVEASFNLAISAEAAGREIIGLGDTVGFNAVACDNDEESNRKHIGGPITGFKWNQADTLLRLVLVKGNEIRNTLAKSKFYVYPNPVQNELRFVATNSIKSIEIYNIEGKLVLKANNPSNSISISILPKGYYNIKAYSANGSVLHQKFVKK